jgi:membrane-associated phospholipid phosphatase
MSTATGIRTPVSAVRGRRPSPLDDGGSAGAIVAAAPCRSATLGGVAESPRALLSWAGVCAGLFLALLATAYGSDAARSLDARALHGFIDLQRPGVTAVSGGVVRLGNALEVGVMAAALAGVALARGRPRVALAVLVLLAATSLSSQVLKAVLAYPRHEAEVAPAAFPSGHATAAMSLALAGVLVAPRRLRPLAAFLGLGFALAVSFSAISQGWHFPSDVAGGFLLAGGWALVIVAALQAAGARWPERSGRARARAAMAGAVDRGLAYGLTGAALAIVVLGLVAVTLLVTTRLSDLVGYADRHTAFVLVAGAVAVLATALLAGLAVALQRRA